MKNWHHLVSWPQISPGAMIPPIGQHMVSSWNLLWLVTDNSGIIR